MAPLRAGGDTVTSVAPAKPKLPPPLVNYDASVTPPPQHQASLLPIQNKAPQQLQPPPLPQHPSPLHQPPPLPPRDTTAMAGSQGTILRFLYIHLALAQNHRAGYYATPTSPTIAKGAHPVPLAMLPTTVFISNVDEDLKIQTFLSFFSFCGLIKQYALNRHGLLTSTIILTTQAKVHGVNILRFARSVGSREATGQGSAGPKAPECRKY